MNCPCRHPTRRSPFALADPDRVRTILESAGFQDIDLEPIDEVVDLGADASDALAFATMMGVVEGLTHGLEPAQRAEAMSNLANLFHEHETPDGVLFASAAWLITARRR